MKRHKSAVYYLDKNLPISAITPNVMAQEETLYSAIIQFSIDLRAEIGSRWPITD
jgi:hypothetical protein